MSRVFDPNTNPYADDLLRLGLAPLSRFSAEERRAIGYVLAGKLYGLESWRFRLVYPILPGVRFRSPYSKDVIAMALLFDRERVGYDLDVIERRLARPYHADTLIALNVGATGLAEIYNGPWMPDAIGRIRSALERNWRGWDEGVSTFEEVIPALSDEALRSNYLGRGDGAMGGGGGEGGGNDGVPPGGDDNMPGAGGTGELLNHPVLFSIDRAALDAILEQV